MKITETVSKRTEARFTLGQDRPGAVIVEARNGRETVRLQLGAQFHTMTLAELRDLQQALGGVLELFNLRGENYGNDTETQETHRRHELRAASA